MYFLTHNALKYTINHILRVAGFSDELLQSIKYFFENDFLDISIGEKTIKFSISSPHEAEALLKGKLKLNIIPTADKIESIPVILNNELPFAEQFENTLLVHADLISISFILMSRYEEKFNPARNRFGNFEFVNSIASVYDFIDFPIIDEYAIILKGYLKEFLPGVTFIERKSRIIPTHDVDRIYRFTTFPHNVKTILGDIYLSRNLTIPVKSFREYFATRKKKANDPFLNGIEILMETSLKYHLRSEFYIMAANKSKINNGYPVNDTTLKKLVKKIIEHEMIIGIHGGFDSFNDYSVFCNEKERLEKGYECPIIFSRQHFLRFDVDNTFNILERSGIKYDSTLVYSERVGYRCGTCHAFFTYDLINDKPRSLIERPTIAMDNTLWSAAGFSLKIALAKLHDLYARCDEVGGDFVILWHNEYVCRRTEWFNNVYLKFLQNIFGY